MNRLFLKKSITCFFRCISAQKNGLKADRIRNVSRYFHVSFVYTRLFLSHCNYLCGGKTARNFSQYCYAYHYHVGGESHKKCVIFLHIFWLIEKTHPPPPPFHAVFTAASWCHRHIFIEKRCTGGGTISISFRLLNGAAAVEAILNPHYANAQPTSEFSVKFCEFEALCSATFSSNYSF